MCIKYTNGLLPVFELITNSWHAFSGDVFRFGHIQELVCQETPFQPGVNLNKKCEWQNYKNALNKKAPGICFRSFFKFFFLSRELQDTHTYTSSSSYKFIWCVIRMFFHSTECVLFIIVLVFGTFFLFFFCHACVCVYFRFCFKKETCTILRQFRFNLSLWSSCFHLFFFVQESSPSSKIARWQFC